MGVCELKPSIEYYQEISNPINISMGSNDTNEKKNTNSTNNYSRDNSKNNININENKKNNLFNIYSKNNEKKKKIDLKTRIINPYKLNNFIINSKTNYSNYKRVPHLKEPNNSLLSKEKNKIKNTNNVNNKL